MTRTALSLVFALLFALPLAAPAGAADPWAGCFARTYDAAHLARNPGQKVRVMFVEVKPSENRDLHLYEAGIGVILTTGKTRYVNDSGCVAEGAALRCTMQTDGGGRVLLTRTDKGLRLENPGRLALEIEDQDRPNEFIHLDGPDHRVFLLPAATKKDCPWPAND